MVGTKKTGRTDHTLNVYFFGVIVLKANLYLNQFNYTIYLNLFTFVLTMQFTITEFNYFIYIQILHG